MAASCAVSRALSRSLSTALTSGSNPTSRLEITNVCAAVPSWHSSAKRRAVARQLDVSTRYGVAAAIHRIASGNPVSIFHDTVNKKSVNRGRKFTVCASAESDDNTGSEKVRSVELGLQSLN